MLNRVIGGYLLLVALAVAVHTVVEPLYHTSFEGQLYSPLWNLLNPLMAVALVIGLIFGYQRKRAADAEADAQAVTREFLLANILFFGCSFVSILFFWNWFNLMSPGFTAIGSETVSLVWILVDAILPLVVGAMGVHMLRSNQGT